MKKDDHKFMKQIHKLNTKKDLSMFAGLMFIFICTAFWFFLGWLLRGCV